MKNMRKSHNLEQFQLKRRKQETNPSDKTKWHIQVTRSSDKFLVSYYNYYYYQYQIIVIALLFHDKYKWQNQRYYWKNKMKKIKWKNKKKIK